MSVRVQPPGALRTACIRVDFRQCMYFAENDLKISKRKMSILNNFLVILDNWMRHFKFLDSRVYELGQSGMGSV